MLLEKSSNNSSPRPIPTKWYPFPNLKPPVQQGQTEDDAYIGILTQICAKDPLDYVHIQKLANALASQGKLAEA